MEILGIVLYFVIGLLVSCLAVYIRGDDYKFSAAEYGVVVMLFWPIFITMFLIGIILMPFILLFDYLGNKP